METNTSTFTPLVEVVRKSVEESLKAFQLPALEIPVEGDDGKVVKMFTTLMTQMLPMMGQLITAAITSSMMAASNLQQATSAAAELKRTEELRLMEEQRQQESSYMQEKARFLTFKADQQEQYSRVNSIRLYNMEQRPDEDTTDIAIKCFESIGVIIPRERVDVSHRVKGGTSRRDPDAIIVKFVRREDKTAVMKRKKQLKDAQAYRKVIIEEDLTAMRKKIVGILRNSGSKDRRVWTVDGKICAKEPKSGGGERFISVNSYRDFLQLQWDDYKCDSIGLYSTF